MRVMIGTTALLAAALLGQVAMSAGAGSSRDEAAITAIEHEMATAQTAEGVTRTWDDAMIWYDIQPGEIVSGKDAKARLAEQIVGVANIRTKILKMTVHADGNLGYALSTQNFIADVKSGGPPLDFIFRETDIFMKKNGKWSLVHQHISIPVDFASGRAVMKAK